LQNLKNLARKDAGFGHRPGISDCRFCFENGEDDGVALDEDFFAA